MDLFWTITAALVAAFVLIGLLRLVGRLVLRSEAVVDRDPDLTPPAA